MLPTVSTNKSTSAMRFETVILFSEYVLKVFVLASVYCFCLL